MAGLKGNSFYVQMLAESYGHLPGNYDEAKQLADALDIQGNDRDYLLHLAQHPASPGKEHETW